MPRTAAKTILPTSIPGISSVQTPTKYDPKTGDATPGEVFYVGTECEHWARPGVDGMVSDCRFGCLARAEREAAA